MRRMLALAIGLVVAGFALTACNIESDTSTSTEYTCCQNGDFYECPSDEEANACFNGEAHDCDRELSRDDECEE